MKKFNHNVTKIKDPNTGEYKGFPAIAGESAYEIAVRLGTFVGTEEEWNNYIKTEREDAIIAVREASDEAISARNTAIENANISTNNAASTSADAAQTGNDRDTAAIYMNRAIDEANKAQDAYNNILTRLGAEPKKWFKTSVEEMNALTGMNQGDVCYVVDFSSGRTAMYFYDTEDMDSDDVNPEWIFLGNAEFIQMNRADLLEILNLSTVALTGDYSDLIGTPNRYSAPIVLDGTGDTVEWDYTQSDTALVTLTEDKPLTITGEYNGAKATLDVYGAKLILDDAVYLKSATYPYLEAIEGEHYHYEFQRIIDKWQVGMMVVAGAEAGESV